MGQQRRLSAGRKLALVLGLAYFAFACAIQGDPTARVHRWYQGLGPVLPHDDFPADCSMCHRGTGWQTMVEDFELAEDPVPAIAQHARFELRRMQQDGTPAE